ncbi:MAG: hypothetical protein ACK501_11545 [Planctomycetota bacterium]
MFALAEGMQERDVTYAADEGFFFCTGRPGPHVVVVTERWGTKCRRIDLPPGTSHFGFPGSPYPATLYGDVYVNVRWPSGSPVRGAAVELVGPGRAMRATSSAFGDAVFREVPLADGLTYVVHARLDEHRASVMLPAHDGANPIGTFYPLTLRDRAVHRVVVGEGEFMIRKGEIDLRRAESATPMHVIPTPIAGGTFDLAAMPGPFVVGFTPVGGVRAEIGSITIPEEPSTSPIPVVAVPGSNEGSIVVEFAAGDGWLAVIPQDPHRGASSRLEWTAVGKLTARTVSAGEYSVLAAPNAGKAVSRTVTVRRGKRVQVSVPVSSPATATDAVCEVRGLEGKAVFVLDEVTLHPTATVRLPVRGEDANLPSMLVKTEAGLAEVLCRGSGMFDWPQRVRELVVGECGGQTGFDARLLLRGQAPQGQLVWSMAVSSGATRTELDGAVELVCGNGAVEMRAAIRSDDARIDIGFPPGRQVFVVPTPSCRLQWQSPFVYVYRRDTEGEPGLANCTFTGAVLAATERIETSLPDGSYVLVGGTSLMDAAFHLSTGRYFAKLRVAGGPVECVLP